MIQFVLSDGRTDEARVERAVRDEVYELRYFGRILTFTIAADGSGTDLTLTCDEPGFDADHVSLLLRLKASVDFGVDLRNHDGTRVTGYADS